MNEASPSSKPPGEPTKTPRWLPRAMMAMVVGAGLLLYIASRPSPGPGRMVERPPLADVFDHVEQLGYVPNHSLAGRYRPGDVLQLQEADAAVPAEGHGRVLATPLLALRGEQCFPGLEPLQSPFPLPRDEGSRQTSLGLEGAQVAKVFPGLSLSDAAVASSRLVFDQPRVLTLAKLELSGDFSADCVARLDAAQAMGDRPEWFETVHEAIVAQGLTFEVEWRSGVTGDVQAALRQQAEAELAALAAGDAPPEGAPPAESPPGENLVTAVQVKVALADERRMVLEVKAPVVLGYRTRPMERHVVAGQVPPPAASERDPRTVFLAESAASFAARLAIRRQQSDGSWQLVDTGHAFRTGDRFRFEVASNRSAELFVFHQPPRGERSELWPATTGAGNRIAAGEPLLVPTPPAAFAMQDDLGMETFFVALADVEIPEQRLQGLSISNYALRGLGDTATRGVGMVYDAEPWLYFQPSEGSEFLATVGFQLHHQDSP